MNKGIFNIANLFTATNMLCGVMAILLALAGRIDIAPLFIFGGLICDFLDGFLARKLGVSGEMGKQLDSLADMITFGLAPGIIMMVVMVASIYLDSFSSEANFASYVHYELSIWLNALFYGVDNDMNASIKYLPFITLFIPFMSMFRLAKFNIDTRQNDSFIGLPTPLNSLFFLFFPLVMYFNFDQWHNKMWSFSFILNPYLLTTLIVLMSLLLVAELPLFSLKIKHFRWKENEVRYVFLAACLLFIIGMGVWAIPFIVILYLILSFIETKLIKSKINEV